MIVEWIVLTEGATRRNASLSLLLRPEEGTRPALMAAESSMALFERITSFFRPYFSRFHDEVRAGVDVVVVVVVVVGASEWILRCILSFVAVDGGHRSTREGQREYLRTYLVPAICTIS